MRHSRRQIEAAITGLLEASQLQVKINAEIIKALEQLKKEIHS